MLTTKELNTFYGHVHALKSISIRVEERNVVTIIGANGAGKSTLLKTICGLITPNSGTVLFRNEEITNYRPEKLVEMGMSLVPEGREIFNNLSVLDNLILGTYTQRRLKRNFSTQLDFVFHLFPALGQRKSQKGGTLSGGEQQMLSIGRALMANPCLVLLDEPSLGLAPILVNQVFTAIEELNENGLTILLVEQTRKAMEMAHRGYVLNLGQVAMEDSGAELLDNEEVTKIYLGGGAIISS